MCGCPTALGPRKQRLRGAAIHRQREDVLPRVVPGDIERTSRTAGFLWVQLGVKDALPTVQRPRRDSAVRRLR